MTTLRQHVTVSRCNSQMCHFEIPGAKTYNFLSFYRHRDEKIILVMKPWSPQTAICLKRPMTTLTTPVIHFFESIRFTCGPGVESIHDVVSKKKKTKTKPLHLSPFIHSCFTLMHADLMWSETLAGVSSHQYSHQTICIWVLPYASDNKLQCWLDSALQQPTAAPVFSCSFRQVYIKHGIFD